MVKKSRIYRQGCFTKVALKRRRKLGEYAGELLRGKRRIGRRINEQSASGVIKVIQIGEALATCCRAGRECDRLD